MDRQLANKNLRDALIATAVVIIMLVMTFVAAVIYLAG